MVSVKWLRVMPFFFFFAGRSVYKHRVDRSRNCSRLYRSKIFSFPNNFIYIEAHNQQAAYPLHIAGMA